MSGTAVARLDDYRPAVDDPGEVAQLRGEVAQLRALVLAMSDAIDHAGEVWRDVARRVVDAACNESYRDGYEAGARWMEADWARLCGRTFHANAPTLAELELRRWGPGGRASWMLPQTDGGAV